MRAIKVSVIAGINGTRFRQRVKPGLLISSPVKVIRKGYCSNILSQGEGKKGQWVKPGCQEY